MLLGEENQSFQLPCSVSDSISRCSSFPAMSHHQTTSTSRIQIHQSNLLASELYITGDFSFFLRRRELRDRLVSLIYKSLPIFDCTIEVSDVDKVERVPCECPLAFSVVDLKLYIRRNPNKVSKSLCCIDLGASYTNLVGLG